MPSLALGASWRSIDPGPSPKKPRAEARGSGVASHHASSSRNPPSPRSRSGLPGGASTLARHPKSPERKRGVPASRATTPVPRATRHPLARARGFLAEHRPWHLAQKAPSGSEGFRRREPPRLVLAQPAIPSLALGASWRSIHPGPSPKKPRAEARGSSAANHHARSSRSPPSPRSRSGLPGGASTLARHPKSPERKRGVPARRTTTPVPHAARHALAHARASRRMGRGF